jgi:hypothetical protein
MDDAAPFPHATLPPPEEKAKPTLLEVRYTHEACIDRVILQPGITQRELAREFGMSEVWMSTVFRSDAFQARLAERKKEVIGPLFATMEEKLAAASHAALDKLTERLIGPVAMKDEVLVRSAEVLLSATGYGARDRKEGSGSTVIINMPGKAPSEAAWAQRYTPPGVSDAVEIRGGTPSGG